MQDLDMDAAKPDVKFWLDQIERGQKWHREWHERGQKVVDRFMDKEGSSLNAPLGHKMNVLWSNVETIKPALYVKAAKPSIQRRFRDKDAAGRWAAVVLERVESYELDAYDDDYHYRQAIQDYLLPGRGQVWVYYAPTISGGSDLRKQKLEWECCKIRHLHWKDFITNPARTWDEVWWVAKREFLTKEEAEAQRLDVSKLVFSEQGQEELPDGSKKANKAAVWEIWSKTHGKVLFVSKLSPELLRPSSPPPLRFDGFFPCPRPLTATASSDSIIPIPDFCLYQNQAAEIDRLSQRINLLTKALRVAGIYDSSQETLSSLVTGDTDNNVLLPCDNWAVFAQQGGVEGSVSFFPLADIIKALEQCYISREQAKAAMYEITGISDIVRGASDASETATAQQIKSQWGGLRIKDRQKEVQRFIRDTMRLKAEVHAEQFQPTTLKTMSNVPLADEAQKKQLQMRVQAQQMAQQNPQMAQQAIQANPQLQALAQPLTMDEQQKLKEPSWEEVVQLLKADKLRGFRIDIETDSTVASDEMEEKKSRTEFLTGMTSFAEAWWPIIMQTPKAAPLAGELMLFASRAFKCADTLEGVIEEFVEAIEQQPPPQQQQDPKAAAEMEKVKLQAQKNQSDAQLKNKEIETKAATTIQVKQMEIGAEREAQMVDHAVNTQEAQQDRQFQAQDKAQDRAFTAQEGAANRQATAQDKAHDRAVQVHEGERSRQLDAGMRMQDAAEHEMDAQREDERESETEDKVLKAITALAGEVKNLSKRVDRIAAAE